MHRAGKAQYRWSRLTSNVRPRETRRAVFERACWRELNSHEAAADSEETGRRATPRGAGASSGEIGKHKDRRLVIGTTLTQVAKVMTGNRRATSQHRAAWEAIVFSRFVGSATGASADSQGRGGSNPRRATLASAERQGAVAGTGNYEDVAGPGRGTERGLTPRSRRGPTALRLARAAPVVHDAPRGQGAIPSVPPHLER